MWCGTPCMYKHLNEHFRKLISMLFPNSFNNRYVFGYKTFFKCKFGSNYLKLKFKCNLFIMSENTKFRKYLGLFFIFLPTNNATRHHLLFSAFYFWFLKDSPQQVYSLGKEKTKQTFYFSIVYFYSGRKFSVLRWLVY